MRAATLLLLLSAGLLPARAAGDEERPFPFAKSTILREGKVVYVVEGQVTIPEGVEISCQKDVYVRGHGEDPTIRVEGALKIHGVSLREVIFENVTIRLAPRFGDVQLDMAIFRGGGGVATTPDAPATGKLFVENVQFEDRARIDVSFENGSVDLSSVGTASETSIRAAKGEDDGKNQLKVKIRACDLRGLLVERARDVTVRLTRLAPGRAEFRDCRTLIFDGNKVNAGVLAFHQSVAGGFRRTRITKCDIYSKELVVHAPKKGGKSRDRIVVDRCWFEGETDPKVLREEIVRDGEDDEENGATVRLVKPLERPNELAGAVDR